MSERLPRVVIVGGGFGGLAAAKALKHTPAQITLIDRSNHHLFQPLLYQVATSVLAPGQIASPIRGILRRQRNTTVILGEVTGVDKELDQDSKPLPGVAQAAIQQGRYAGRLVHFLITSSATPAPFRYFDKGNMAVVGKGFAVLQSGKVHLSGFFAWLAWAFVHLQFLATSNLRVSVFVQWVWTYMTGQRGSRLIVQHHGAESERATTPT